MPLGPQKFRPARPSRPPAAGPKIAPKWRKWYGWARWKKLRNWHLARHPLCAVCLDAGRTTAGAEVDHIIPHRGDARLFWDPENLQTLCKPDHSRKTISGR